MSTGLVVQFFLQINHTHELLSRVGEWENTAAVCEHKEFSVGKFVVMCRRRRVVYLQLCTFLAMCTHEGFENRNPM
jgi:hypothetical protein